MVDGLPVDVETGTAAALWLAVNVTSADDHGRVVRYSYQKPTTGPDRTLIEYASCNKRRQV